MKVKSESEVAQSCPTLSDPMDRSPPGSSVHGIFQARVLEWVAIQIVVPLLSSHAQPWETYLAFLGLSFLINKMGTAIDHFQLVLLDP